MGLVGAVTDAEKHVVYVESNRIGWCQGVTREDGGARCARNGG